MSVASISNTTASTSSNSAVVDPGKGLWYAGMKSVASMLGISYQQLHTSLASGQTLAQILTANGKTADQGAQSFLDGINSALSAKVAAGTLGEHQAQNILKFRTAHINGLLGTSVPVPTLNDSASSTASTNGSSLDALA